MLDNTRGIRKLSDKGSNIKLAQDGVDTFEINFMKREFVCKPSK